MFAYIKQRQIEHLTTTGMTWKRLSALHVLGLPRMLSWIPTPQARLGDMSGMSRLSVIMMLTRTKFGPLFSAWLRSWSGGCSADLANLHLWLIDVPLLTWGVERGASCEVTLGPCTFCRLEACNLLVFSPSSSTESTHCTPDLGRPGFDPPVQPQDLTGPKSTLPEPQPLAIFSHPSDSSSASSIKLSPALHQITRSPSWQLIVRVSPL